MPPISQPIVLALLILLTTIAVLGILRLFLPDEQGEDHLRRRLTKRPTSSADWSGITPVFDNSWPELRFELGVGNARLRCVYMLITALGVGLAASVIVSQESTHSIWSILIFATPIILLASGCVALLSSFPRWQSRIVLEAERLVVYPTFGRASRVVNYDQIWDVSSGEERLVMSTGALIYYYPLDYAGQIDVMQICQMRLPSTSQNEGLRLVLRARMAGTPPDPELASAFYSKQMVRPLAPWAILFGIVLLALALQPESRERVLLVPLALLEIGLLLTVIVMGWPVRRK